MHRTNIYLDDAQVAALDAAARREGTTRAELVRRFVDLGLTRDQSDVDRDLAVIRESFGALRDAEDVTPERGDGARGEHLDVMWAS
jgi:metal-responsive CopG/Arc/MetJ family transcriptional regulator